MRLFMIHQIDHMNSFEIEEECQRVLDFCLAEGFYIFTVIHHVQSNDQKKFYRDRTLYSAMRLLYVIVHIRSKTDIDEMTKGENDFTANISHLKQLNKLLLTKIKQYEIVQPLEMMIFKQIKDFLTENGYHHLLEAETNYIVKYFDSCPTEHSYNRLDYQE